MASSQHASIDACTVVVNAEGPTARALRAAARDIGRPFSRPGQVEKFRMR
jgi:hypothetical protein